MATGRPFYMPIQKPILYPQAESVRPWLSALIFNMFPSPTQSIHAATTFAFSSAFSSLRSLKRHQINLTSRAGDEFCHYAPPKHLQNIAG